MIFGHSAVGRALKLGIGIAAVAFVLATGTASAAYFMWSGDPSEPSTAPADSAAISTAPSVDLAADAAPVFSGMLRDPARDPNELDAAAQSQAFLAAREAQAQADVAARAQAEAEAQARAQAAAAVAAAEEQAEQARAAATNQAAVEAATAAATSAQVTVSSALVDARGSIQQAAAAAGWPGDLLAKVERVVMCESSGQTNAVSSGGYVGLMQVAPWLHGAVPADAVGQLAQAYQVYSQQGWSAWPVCGSY